MEIINRRAVIDQVVDNYFDYCSTFTLKFRDDVEGNQIHKQGFINCYWDPERKLVYMHIDKCGSTSITTALRHQKLEFIKMDTLSERTDPDILSECLVKNNYQFFTFVRDPKSRWISGLHEFIFRFNPSIKYVIDQVKSGKYIFDEHTAPQHLFLTFPLKNNAKFKFFKLDDNLSNKINKILKETLSDNDKILNYKELEISHLRETKNFIPNYSSICKKIYKTYIEKTPEKFNELYKLDYKLYEGAI
jgi:hypothetical protein